MLGHLLDMTYNKYFFVNIQSACNLAAVPLFSHSFSALSARPSLLPIDFLIETVLNNRIKIYGDASVVKQISDLVAEYPLIWEF